MSNCVTRYNNEKKIQENFGLSGGQIAGVVIATIFFLIGGFILLDKLKFLLYGS